MNAVTKPQPRDRGFSVYDRGGRVRVHSLKGSGTGTVLVFKGSEKPRKIHI